VTFVSVELEVLDWQAHTNRPSNSANDLMVVVLSDFIIN
jgi:hypothetical protein